MSLAQALQNSLKERTASAENGLGSRDNIGDRRRGELLEATALHLGVLLLLLGSEFGWIDGGINGLVLIISLFPLLHGVIVTLTFNSLGKSAHLRHSTSFGAAGTEAKSHQAEERQQKK